MGQAGFPILATLASAVFSGVLVKRYLERRRPYLAAWAASLAMFSLGSLFLAWGTARSWTPLVFRWYYLFGAVLNVPYLALGSMYLLASRATARAFLLGVLIFTALGTAVVLFSPLRGPVPAHELPEGKLLFPALPRVAAVLGNGVGTLVVVGGLLWSAWVYWSKRVRPEHVAGNLLITLGVLSAAAGGVFAGLGRSASLGLALALGSTLMFAGFLVASRIPKRPRPPGE